MSPDMILAIAYLLTTAVKQGLTIKQILDSADDAGMIDDSLKAQILSDLQTAEAAWKAKRGTP